MKEAIKNHCECDRVIKSFLSVKNNHNNNKPELLNKRKQWFKNIKNEFKKSESIKNEFRKFESRIDSHPNNLEIKEKEQSKINIYIKDDIITKKLPLHDQLIKTRNIIHDSNTDDKQKVERIFFSNSFHKFHNLISLNQNNKTEKLNVTQDPFDKNNIKPKNINEPYIEQLHFSDIMKQNKETQEFKEIKRKTNSSDKIFKLNEMPDTYIKDHSYVNGNLFLPQNMSDNISKYKEFHGILNKSKIKYSDKEIKDINRNKDLKEKYNDNEVNNELKASKDRYYDQWPKYRSISHQDFSYYFPKVKKSYEAPLYVTSEDLVKEVNKNIQKRILQEKFIKDHFKLKQNINTENKKENIKHTEEKIKSEINKKEKEPTITTKEDNKTIKIKNNKLGHEIKDDQLEEIKTKKGKYIPQTTNQSTIKSPTEKQFKNTSQSTNQPKKKSHTTERSNIKLQTTEQSMKNNQSIEQSRKKIKTADLSKQSIEKQKNNIHQTKIKQMEEKTLPNNTKSTTANEKMRRDNINELKTNGNKDNKIEHKNVNDSKGLKKSNEQANDEDTAKDRVDIVKNMIKIDPRKEEIKEDIKNTKNINNGNETIEQSTKQNLNNTLGKFDIKEFKGKENNIRSPVLQSNKQNLDQQTDIAKKIKEKEYDKTVMKIDETKSKVTDNVNDSNKKSLEKSKGTPKNLEIKDVKVRKLSNDDDIMKLIKVKQKPKCLSDLNITPLQVEEHKGHKNKTDDDCLICQNSELELDIESICRRTNQVIDVGDIIIGNKIFKCKHPLKFKKQKPDEPLPMLFKKDCSNSCSNNGDNTKNNINIIKDKTMQDENLQQNQTQTKTVST